ncbi:3-isopropylmalate dehydratase large subunit [Patescibacteria group bacterium]|nr:3-isopropylmalate dehydratase large subunit [Patescibacteria group bacterium]
MAKNIIEKIWDLHVVSEKEGQPAVFAIDLQLMHEVTSAQAFDELRQRGIKVAEPQHCVATIDHSIPTRKDRENIYDEKAKTQIVTLRNNCEEFGIPLLDLNSGKQGIVHVVGPEMGLTQPGMTIVCGDSHTATHGAFGAMAFGVGTTEVGHVLATGCILQKKPKTMRVNFNGALKPGVYAKDAALALIAKIGIGGANGHVIEYAGEAARKMSMEARMTVSNMSIECGARAGIFAPDQITYDYLKNKPHAPSGEEWDRAAQYWDSFVTDEGATFDLEVEIDLDRLDPMITWGTNPEQGMMIGENVPNISELPKTHRLVAEKALAYTGLKQGEPIEGTKIDWAFIGSCTNGRIEDFRVAAEILKGKKIAENVTCYLVPGSEAVKKQAEDEGLDKIFIEAGADWRMPGCSMCLGMNDDKVPGGMRCISSSNRNFVGRQGTGSITHLASPAMVAVSAIEGKIANPVKFFN